MDFSFVTSRTAPKGVMRDALMSAPMRRGPGNSLHITQRGGPDLPPRLSQRASVVVSIPQHLSARKRRVCCPALSRIGRGLTGKRLRSYVSGRNIGG